MSQNLLLKCQNCQQVINTNENSRSIEQKEVCQNCQNKNFDKSLRKDSRQKFMDNTEILEHLKLLDYQESFSLNKVKCKIHEEPFEYYSKTDLNFACLKCLTLYLQNDCDKPENIIPITSSDVTQDIMMIICQLKYIIQKAEQYLKVQEEGDDDFFLPRLFKGAIKLFNYFYNEDFTKKLKICQVKVSDKFLLSKINNSKVQISEEIKVKSLKDFSKIITNDEDEAFVNNCFEKKFDLGFLYRASENDFSSEKFHKACDNQGPTLCLYLSEKNRIFGGYADKSWFSHLNFKHSKNSFLFSLKFKKKLKIYKNFEKALFFSSENGPCFGEDLIIKDKCNQKRSCRSFLGKSYEPCEGSPESFEAQKSLAGFPTFSLKEYEVYKIKFKQIIIFIYNIFFQFKILYHLQILYQSLFFFHLLILFPQYLLISFQKQSQYFLQFLLMFLCINNHIYQPYLNLHFMIPISLLLNLFYFLQV